VEEPKVTEAAPADAKSKDSKGKPVDPKATDPKAKAADSKAKDAKTKAAEAKAAADAKAKAKKPAPPSHPSRIWVQIGVGRDKDAIAFDWRRYNREAPALFKGRQPYISDMGRTNRILVGPFATQKAAATFLADAKKQGFSGALPWTSPAGQVVDTLSAK
jgi:cell division protein FtsN